MDSQHNVQQKAQHKARWKYLIYPKFQLKLIGFNIFIIILAFALTQVQMYRAFSHFKNIGTSLNLPEHHIFYQYIEYQFTSCLIAILIACFLSIVLTSCGTLLLSFRLAGPIVRLRSYFEQISKGAPLTEIAFRKNDYFSDLPAEINKALGVIKNKNTGDKAQ